MKKIALIALMACSFSGCAEMQQVANQLPGILEQGNIDVSSGLKEALNNGISNK